MTQTDATTEPDLFGRVIGAAGFPRPDGLPPRRKEQPMTTVPQQLDRSTRPAADQPAGVRLEARDSVPSPSRTDRALVGTVQDLIALGLLAMQAHWHPGRRNFRPLHELLDDIADRALEVADNLAERATAVGWAAASHPARVADEHTFETLGAVARRDRDAITTFEGILEIFAAELHQRLGELGDEPFTHELLAVIAVEVDKHASTTAELSYRHQDPRP
jgi:starvation-inducible DNA-binding protein